MKDTQNRQRLEEARHSSRHLNPSKESVFSSQAVEIIYTVYKIIFIQHLRVVNVLG